MPFTVCDTVSQGSTGRFESAENGFGKWLESQQHPIDRRRAERYMQGARNCGLTAESNITSLQAIKEEKRLHGRDPNGSLPQPGG